MGQIEAKRIDPLGSKKIRAARKVGQGDVGEGIGGDHFGGNIRIDDLVDKGAVGAVFQQPSHQIGQQIAVRADRRIDAAARGVAGLDNGVQRLAHAVQPLEFERGITCHVQDRGGGMSVMRGELRIDPVGHAQQFLCIGNIGDVGGGFGGENRESGHAHDLRGLDFRVPIGAFDQPHHQATIMPGGHVVDRVDHRAAARGIGLYHDAETVPARQRRLAQHRVEHRQGKGEAVGFLGVHVQPHARRFGQQRQRAQTRHQIAHHVGGLGDLVARMQSGEFDGNTRIGPHVIMSAGGGNGRDRARIAQMIAGRVGLGTSRLAKHVIGIREALCLHPGGAFHCGINGFAQNKLAAHLLHRAGHGGADHRLAQPFDRAAQGGSGPRSVVVQHPARQHQRPGRSIDQR